MKFEKPPNIDYKDYFAFAWQDQYKEFLKKSDDKYYYWDDLKYRKDAPFKLPEENWALIKAHRFTKQETLKFGSNYFKFYVTKDVLENLHNFDLKLMGGLHENPLLSSDRFEFLKSLLLEEAVASSQVEGAATTIEVARDMLKSGRKPRNESEQMIFNNLRAINFMRDRKEDPIDFKMIFELHSLMTANTEAGNCSRQFRTGDVYVTDHVDGEVAHTPPEWQLIEQLMGEVCEFINDEKNFIHPIIKASIIHFMIGFIHPFLDGNGRTARALFYWFLLKKGYTLIGNISISRVILKSRTQYDKAFLKTESDENDLNYFITYSIKNMRVAFEKLVNYRDKKLEERKRANSISYELISRGLNKRQADVLTYLFYSGQSKVTLNDYAGKNEIVRQTAKKDLSELMKLGLIREDKTSKPYKYTLTSKESLTNFI